MERDMFKTDITPEEFDTIEEDAQYEVIAAFRTKIDESDPSLYKYYEFHNACIGDTLYFDLPDAFAAKSRIFPTVADDELRQRVLDLNTEIITGFGLKQGITHSEFIMDGDDIYLIETAAHRHRQAERAPPDPAPAVRLRIPCFLYPRRQSSARRRRPRSTGASLRSPQPA